MGLKSRQTTAKNSIAKSNNLDATAPPGVMEGVMAPRVPVTSKSMTSLTPYQRMKQLLATRATNATTITTIDDLQQFLVKHPSAEEKVTIRMKLLWISDHTYMQWQLVRLHLVDADSPESLDDLLSVFYAPYEANHHDVDTALLTVTVWNTEGGSDLLPPPGAVVTIRNYSNLKLYQDAQCQLTARLSQLSWDGAQQ
ncbi:hypothetical protein DVH05_027331 [Phytophthora capsici]|nr:hypothetical protein DVH05_027331 [Phytophthora capsici]